MRTGSGCTAMALALMLAACAEGAPGPGGDVELSSSIQALNNGQTAGFGAVSWEYIADPNYEHLKWHLPSLVGHGISLTINVPSEKITRMPPNTDSPWVAIDEAVRLNIPLTLWLTLPEFQPPMSNYTKALDPTGNNYHSHPTYKTTGYFANQSNAVEYVAKLTALKNAFQDRHPGKKARLLIDMEIRKELMPLYDPTDTPANQVDFFTRYGGLGRAAEYNAALTTYKDFVASVRSAGWDIDVSTFVQMLDDYADGDASLRHAYGAVLDDPRVPGATNWSRMYIQAFTTLYGEMLPMTNYFVYDYARLAKNVFGSKASVDVGLTHGGIDPTAPTYWSPIPLAQDTSAALAAGIPRTQIEVYSYFGFYDDIVPTLANRPTIAAHIEDWMFPVIAINFPPPADVGTGVFRSLNHAADAYFPAQ